MLARRCAGFDPRLCPPHQGLAPQLKSDRVDERALRKIPRMARARPRKYIALNREDDAWVPGKLDGRKVRLNLHQSGERMSTTNAFSPGFSVATHKNLLNP